MFVRLTGWLAALPASREAQAVASLLSLVISLVPEISPVLEVVEDLLLFTRDDGWERLDAPLTAMVADRSGRSWRITLRMARPVRLWVSRATARAVNTMVRCASIASRLRTNMGRAARSVLLILKDCSTCHRSWYRLMTSAGGMTETGRLVT